MSEISDAQIARMVMLSGLNWDNDEIAAEMDVHESTVGKYLNMVEDKSKSMESWDTYYWSVVLADVFDSDFREVIAGNLQ